MANEADYLSLFNGDELTAKQKFGQLADLVRRQRALGALGLGTGDPAQAAVGKELNSEADTMASGMLGAAQHRAEQGIQRMRFGPSQRLGGATPEEYTAETGRLAVPKFTSVFPGSQMFSVRTGQPAPQPPGGNPGNDIIKQTADGIMQGISPPDMKGLGRLRVPVQAELATRGFNLSQANLDWQATQKHLATLNSGGQERLNQAINFVSDTIPVIRQLYGEWQQIAGQSGFKVINKATLAAMKQLPGRAGAVAQALDTQINDFGAELGTVYKGGGTSTDKSLGMAASNLQADWNPETFNKALDLAERNIAIRKNSMTHSMTRGGSAGNPYGPATPQQSAGTHKVYNPATGQIEDR